VTKLTVKYNFLSWKGRSSITRRFGFVWT